MTIKDTTLAGAVAGVIGAICGLTFGITLKWFGLTDRTFHDFAQVFILSKLEPGLFGFFIGALAHLGVGGMNGAIFAHFIEATSPKYLIIKGIFLGVTMWLIFIGLGNYFRLPMFCNMPPMSALITWLNSAVYGLTMSFTLSRLTR
jgi:hypothetical protein